MIWSLDGESKGIDPYSYAGILYRLPAFHGQQVYSLGAKAWQPATKIKQHRYSFVPNILDISKLFCFFTL